MVNRAVRRYRDALLLILAVVLDVCLLAPVLTARDLSVGALKRGYFESFEGQTALIVDDGIHSGMFPTFHLAGGRSLVLPPGFSISLSLPPGVELSVRAADADVPYLVLGDEQLIIHRPEDPPEPPTGRIVVPRAFDIRDGQLVLVPWNAAAPWRDDAKRLAAISETCAGSKAASFVVTASGDHLAVAIGTCSLETSSTADTRLAVIAGPNWLTVGRNTDWLSHRTIAWSLVALVLLKTASTRIGLGSVFPVVFSAVTFVEGLQLRTLGILTWWLTFLLALPIAAVRALWALLRRLRPRVRWMVVSVGALSVGGVLALLWTQIPVSIPLRVFHGGESSGDSCVVEGYSTVADEGLRGRIGGIQSLLDEQCPSCRARTSGICASGWTFGALQRSTCATPPSLGARGAFVFLGGANDDLIWGINNLASVYVGTLRGIDEARSAFVDSARRSLASIRDQQRAIEQWLQCIADRNARAIYLHDFLVTDLPAGRDESRAAMLARRRDSVEAHGGVFFDLYRVFGAEAGVSWFNDFIHLSVLGHHRVAHLACTEIAARSKHLESP